MLDSGTRLKLASDAIGAKLIEGEAVILHAETGHYHSIDGAGAVAWQRLAAGHSPAEAASAIAEAYGSDSEQVLADVTRLAGELIAQGLLVAGEGVQPGEAAAIDSGGLPYATPALITFGDIEDLLALDPPVPLMGNAAWKAERRS